jgi:hypothetical protein
LPEPTGNRSSRATDTPPSSQYRTEKTYSVGKSDVTDTRAPREVHYQRSDSLRDKHAVVQYRKDEARTREARREIKKLITG